MIRFHDVTNGKLRLATDLAAEFPIYVYLCRCGSKLLYSTDIVSLLDHQLVEKPLRVSDKGLSFVLQCGVVPPPNSIYENLYIIGIGDTLHVETIDDILNIKFSKQFPFYSTDRSGDWDGQKDDKSLLQTIAEVCINRQRKGCPNFLFHSAGKDSNTIALSLAEAGLSNQYTLLSHKSKGVHDESGISKKIATKLGFKHIILRETQQLERQHYDHIDEHFRNSPFPCTDNVALAYPLYLTQLSELRAANLIDGGGNDSYMMTPLKQREHRLYKVLLALQNFTSLRRYINSESILSPMLRTIPEWYGMNGLNEGDIIKVMSNMFPVSKHWRKEFAQRGALSAMDTKTEIYSTVTISEMHIRKIRNFSDAFGSNLILPFANSSVVKHFRNISTEHLVDERRLRNKLLLRDLLNSRLGLDSDKIGKMAYTFNYDGHVEINITHIRSEILTCAFLDQHNIKKIFSRLEAASHGSGWTSRSSKRLIYRLYLICGWLNKNRWLQAK